MSSKANAQEFVFGPFTGGLNEVEASEASEFQDNELYQCINLELVSDGTLRGRPPIEVGLWDVGVWGTNMHMIGCGLFDGVPYIFGCSVGGIYVTTGEGVAWTKIANSVESRCALQYRDRMYIIPTEDTFNPGGFYDPATSTWTTDTNIPAGDAAIFHKSRLFVVAGWSSSTNTSRMTFSEPITSTTITWDAADFVDVSPGDGQKLVDIIVYNDHLMLFKEDSTYVFAYDIFPADAVLRIVNENIGARGWKCVVQYESAVYVYHNAHVYEMVNYQWERIDDKIDIAKGVMSTSALVDPFQSEFICLFGDRLILRFHFTWFSYSLLTRTWSKWESYLTPVNYVGPLQIVHDPERNFKYYFAGTVHPNKAEIIYFRDRYTTDATDQEWDSNTLETKPIKYVVETKNYGFDSPGEYKKLKYWIAEVNTSEDVTPTIEGLAGAKNVRAATTVSVEKTVTLTPISGQDKYALKFKGGFRFKEIYFYLEAQSTSGVASPPPLFGKIRAIVGLKQTAANEVS